MSRNFLFAELFRQYVVSVMSADPVAALAELQDAVGEYLGFHGDFRIQRNTYNPNPRDDANYTTLHLPHRRAQYGDAGSVSPEEASDVVWQRPIYFYDHGGVTFSAKPFGDRFDSGQAGVQYVTQAQLDELNIGRDEPLNKVTIVAYADDELAEYVKYVEGGGDNWTLHLISELGDEGMDFTADTLEEAIKAVSEYTDALKDKEPDSASYKCFAAAWADRWDAEEVA